LFASQRARVAAAIGASDPRASTDAARRIAAGWRQAEELGLTSKLHRGAAQAGTWAALDPELYDIVADYVDAVAPALGAAINRRFVPYAEAAIDRWPVRSGLSRSLLIASLGQGRPGEIVARLADGAPYALLIRWKTARLRLGWKSASTRARGVLAALPPGSKPGGSVWWDLARRPQRAVADAIARDVELGVTG